MSDKQGKYDLVLIVSTLHELNLRDMLGKESYERYQAHDGSTQYLLNHLYEYQVGAIEAEIERALPLLRGKQGPLSVVDIGCGFIPYSKAFVDFCNEGDSECINLDLWDNGTVSDDSREKLAVLEKYKDNIESKFYGSDVRAVLHPLYAFTELLCLEGGGSKVDGGSGQETFLFRLLESISRRLLKPGGHLLVGEFYYPSHMQVKEQEEAAAALRKMTGHGDPPVAFFDPDTLVLEAKRAGYSLDALLKFPPLRHISSGKLSEQEKYRISQREYAIAHFKTRSSTEEPAEEVKRNILMRLNLIGFFADEVDRHLGNILPDLGGELKGRLSRRIGADIFDKSKPERIEVLYKTLSRENWRQDNVVPQKRFGLRQLSDRTNELITLWDKSESGSARTYSSLWISLSSRLASERLREDPNVQIKEDEQQYEEYGRYNSPVIELDKGKERAQKQNWNRARSYTYVRSLNHGKGATTALEPLWESGEAGVGQVERIVNSGEDWSSIAYNNLLVPQGVSFQDENIEGPSIHRWLVYLSKRLGDKEFKSDSDISMLWKRSVTICNPMSSKAAVSDHPAQIRSASLMRGLKEDRLRHHIVFQMPPIEECNTNLGTNMDNELRRSLCPQKVKSDEFQSFCSFGCDETWDDDTSKAYVLIRQSIAAVFNDFILLSRTFSNANPQDHGKTKGISAHYKAADLALEKFEDRWSEKNAQVYFCDTVADVHKRKDTAVYVLPAKYQLNITEAAKQGRRLLAELSELDLSVSFPSVWTTLALGEPGSSVPLPSFMVFSDEFVGADCFEHAVAEFLRPMSEQFNV